MLRLRMWARLGLVALALATAAAWVTVSVTPSYAASPGTKSLDPGASDPTGGSDPTVGDPDGPTGDVSPAGGSLSGGSAYGSGIYSSAVQSPTVGAAVPSQRWSLWARWKLALKVWMRAMFLRL